MKCENGSMLKKRFSYNLQLKQLPEAISLLFFCVLFIFFGHFNRTLHNENLEKELQERK